MGCKAVRVRAAVKRRLESIAVAKVASLLRYVSTRKLDSVSLLVSDVRRNV